MRSAHFSLYIIGFMFVLINFTAESFMYVKNIPQWQKSPPMPIRCGMDTKETSDGIDEDNNEWSKKLLALELLEVLSSPNDPDDKNYNVEYDIRRDELLNANTYDELKANLKIEGLSTSGDKLEMITRLLVNAVDPTMDYSMRYNNGIYFISFLSRSMYLY